MIRLTLVIILAIRNYFRAKELQKSGALYAFLTFFIIIASSFAYSYIGIRIFGLFSDFHHIFYIVIFILSSIATILIADSNPNGYGEDNGNVRNTPYEGDEFYEGEYDSTPKSK